MPGYQESAPEGTIASSMPGPRSHRRRSNANGRPQSFTLTLTSAQLDVLDSFYLTDCVSGAVVFTWTTPREIDGSHQAISCRWLAQPVYSNMGGDLYSVTCATEMLKRDVPDRGV